MAIVTSPRGCVRVSLPNSIVMRRFVAEAVLLDVNSGRYFRIDRDGGVMLEALLRTATLDEAVTLLCDQGWGRPDVVREDLVTLVRELSEMGLVRVADETD